MPIICVLSAQCTYMRTRRRRLVIVILSYYETALDGKEVITDSQLTCARALSSFLNIQSAVL